MYLTVFFQLRSLQRRPGSSCECFGPAASFQHRVHLLPYATPVPHLAGNRGLILQTQILHRPLEERDAAAGQIHRAPSSTCHPSAPASSQRTPQRLLQVFYKMCREHPEVMKRHMVCRLSNRVSIQMVLRMLTPAGWPCLSVSRVKFRATFYPVLLSMGPARLPASQRRSHAGPTSFVSFCIR